MTPDISRRSACALIAASAVFLAPVPGEAADTAETLFAKQADLAKRADALAGKLIGPFNSKSSIEPWTDGIERQNSISESSLDINYLRKL